MLQLMILHKDPDQETMANRRAGTAMVRDAAARGCPIAGALAELERFAHEAGYNPESMTEYAEDDGWDDVRPF